AERDPRRPGVRAEARRLTGTGVLHEVRCHLVGLLVGLAEERQERGVDVLALDVLPTGREELRVVARAPTVPDLDAGEALERGLFAEQHSARERRRALPVVRAVGLHGLDDLGVLA